MTSALLAGAIDFARRNGARAIEACPIDAKPKMAAASLYVGATGVFARAGFAEAARRRDNRPLMRLTLAPAPRRAGPGRKR
ncbi:MAG TPA: hypothetical protein VG983_06790 [Caulobacterales bacterium]|nr:hypothetical protein [Caulobacterales bacterium]